MIQKAHQNFVLLNKSMIGCKYQNLKSFHFQCRILFTFPSQYFYAIAIKKYLEFEDGTPIFKKKKRFSLLKNLHLKTYRTITFFGKLFQTFLFLLYKLLYFAFTRHYLQNLG